MKAIAIYIEGGGDTVEQKKELRTGLDVLFGSQKRAAQEKRLGWKTIPCGGRQQTYEAFVNERRYRDTETLCILLVDSEDPIATETNRNDVNAQVRKRHLEQRDRWDLSEVSAEHVHLMVQCMEAWIVADSDAMARFYGQHFRAASLPNRANLEEELKGRIYDTLIDATRNTQKGPYAKIKHASKLLAIVSPDKIASRCRRFKTLTAWLSKIIEST